MDQKGGPKPCDRQPPADGFRAIGPHECVRDTPQLLPLPQAARGPPEQPQMIQKRREVIHNCILVAELDVEPCHLMTVDQQIVALHVAMDPACRQQLRCRFRCALYQTLHSAMNQRVPPSIGCANTARPCLPLPQSRFAEVAAAVSREGSAASDQPPRLMHVPVRRKSSVRV